MRVLSHADLEAYAYKVRTAVQPPFYGEPLTHDVEHSDLKAMLEEILWWRANGKDCKHHPSAVRESECHLIVQETKP